MQEGIGRHCGVSPHAMPTPNGTSTVTRGFTHEVPFLRGQVTMLDYKLARTLDARGWTNLYNKFQGTVKCDPKPMCPSSHSPDSPYLTCGTCRRKRQRDEAMYWPALTGDNPCLCNGWAGPTRLRSLVPWRGRRG